MAATWIYMYNLSNQQQSHVYVSYTQESLSFVLITFLELKHEQTN